MDISQHGWGSRNRIRLWHEVVCRFHASDPRGVYGHHRSFQHLLALYLAPYATGGNRLRSVDGHWGSGTAILGMALLGESAAPLKVLCIIVILAGVIGLKFVPGN
jgi:hypothetical protein